MTMTLSRPAPLDRRTTPCEADPDLWFSEALDDVREAQSRCLNGCPLAALDACRARGEGETWGVWGGTSVEDRREVRERVRSEARQTRERRAARIIELHAQGMNQLTIAREVGTSQPNVSNVIRAHAAAAR